MIPGTTTPARDPAVCFEIADAVSSGRGVREWRRPMTAAARMMVMIAAAALVPCVSAALTGHLASLRSNCFRDSHQPVQTRRPGTLGPAFMYAVHRHVFGPLMVDAQDSARDGHQRSIVKKLRDLTGAGMMECKAALTESGGASRPDHHPAQARAGAATKKAGRSTTRG